MNPALKDIWQHMQSLGLGALAHANRHAAYTAMENQRWPELAVLQAAHSAELLIKARIAQEHPLLIFEDLPRSTQAVNKTLDWVDLFEKGRTLEWKDLPERLWAVTGIVLPNKPIFEAFGRLRNGIQHFGPPPGKDPGEETLNFVFNVIDPFINSCWGLYAIDYDEDYEPYLYFVGTLVSRELLFLVSPKAAKTSDDWDVEWDKTSKKYKNEMLKRIEDAKRMSKS